MFSDNLKRVRKEKGYTQEELAIKLNVVRQTISKWEKGLSVPDAEVLSQLADVLEVDVSVLLGRDLQVTEDKQDEMAIQLAKISEQLAIKNQRSKRIWRAVRITCITILVLFVLMIALNIIAFNQYKFNTNTVEQITEVEEETE